MAADCSFFRSSSADTVCTPFCSADDCALLILPLIKGFHHGLCAVLLSGCHRIAHTSTGQSLSRFSRRFAKRMAADCLFFHSSKAFTTVCAPYCSADVSGLLILPLVKVFPGLRIELLNGCQRIAPTSAFQRLSRRFAPRIALRMALDRSYFCSSTAFPTFYGPF